MDQELRKIKEVVDDTMELFMYIKLALALGEEFPTIIALINPPFNPLKTIEKYSACQCQCLLPLLPHLIPRSIPVPILTMNFPL